MNSLIQLQPLKIVVVTCREKLCEFFNCQCMEAAAYLQEGLALHMTEKGNAYIFVALDGFPNARKVLIDRNACIISFNLVIQTSFFLITLQVLSSCGVNDGNFKGR